MHTWAYPVNDVEGCLIPVPLVPVHIHISRGYMCYEVIVCDLYVSRSLSSWRSRRGSMQLIHRQYRHRNSNMADIGRHLLLLVTCQIWHWSGRLRSIRSYSVVHDRPFQSHAQDQHVFTEDDAYPDSCQEKLPGYLKVRRGGNPTRWGLAPSCIILMSCTIRFKPESTQDWTCSAFPIEWHFGKTL